MSRETPFFNEAFYRDPDVRYKYETPFHESTIQSAYNVVATTTKESQTDEERAVIGRGVISLEAWGLKLSGPLKPEWAAILARHRALNPDLYFFWAYLVDAEAKATLEPAPAPTVEDVGSNSGPQVELELTTTTKDAGNGGENDRGRDIFGPAAKPSEGERST
jgi:hypothetical protein